MRSLRETAHQHEEAILVHLERLPELADTIADGPSDGFRARFDEECRFLTGQLIPHVQAVEAGIYPDLERVLQDLHSLVPMRREHQELTRLMRSLDGYRGELEAGRLGPAERAGLRRALYRLYSILKVHLAEEGLFIGVLEDALADRQKDALARALRHVTAEPL